MSEPAPQIRVHLPIERIEEFCRRFGVRELSLFGSVLRSDFRPDSDVDVLLDFHPGHGLTLENSADIEEGLKLIFGRDVDVIEKGHIRGRIRTQQIMSSRRVVYAA